MTYLPVYLRDVIIHPAITRPEQYIGIQVIVILQTICFTTQRIVLLVTVNTERTDTEFHPRFQATDGFMNLLDQYVHVASAPVGTVGESSAVTGKARIIGEVDTLCRIRIKVVVHMDGIHIVTRNNVCHHHTDVTAALGQCRIKIQLIIVGDKPFRMDIVQVIGCQFTLERCLYPIRVDPRMDLHSPFMAFVKRLHGSNCEAYKASASGRT